MAEEYDLNTDELIGKQHVLSFTFWILILMAYVYVSNKKIWYFSERKWRHKSALGAQGQWQVEVGEPLAGPVPSTDSEVIKENCSNVGFLLCSLWL